MSNPTYTDSVVVNSSPEALYDLVADITRIGEWSPICKACWWNDGEGPRVGAWFTGRNETPERTWETESKVVAAERGREFTFVVNGSMVRWSYTFEPVEAGTRLIETWEFLPDGINFFRERFGADAQAHIDERTETAHASIPATLAAIKRTAESG